MNRADEIQKIVEDNEFMGGICLDREHYILVKPKIVAQALLSAEEARMKPLREMNQDYYGLANFADAFVDLMPSHRLYESCRQDLKGCLKKIKGF